MVEEGKCQRIGKRGGGTPGMIDCHFGSCACARGSIVGQNPSVRSTSIVGKVKGDIEVYIRKLKSWVKFQCSDN